MNLRLSAVVLGLWVGGLLLGGIGPAVVQAEGGMTVAWGLNNEGSMQCCGAERPLRKRCGRLAPQPGAEDGRLGRGVGTERRG